MTSACASLSIVFIFILFSQTESNALLLAILANTHFVILRRQLVQQLLDTILFAGTVDVGHFVVWQLAEVQTDLGSG